MKKIEKEIGLVFLFLIPLLSSAQETIITAGIPVFSPISEPVIDGTGVGFEVGVARKKTKSYYIGMNVDLMLLSKRRSVDVPNNLLVGENIFTALKLASFSIANRFDLTPNSKAKLFFDTNIGFRFGTFDATHEGYLLFFKTTDKLFSKTVFGLTGQFFMCFYIPLKESSRFGLQLKTGITLGSSITYIKNESVTYTNSTWTYGEPRQSSASFWVNAIDLAWHFDRN